MNRIFEGACRRLGLNRVQYRKREVCFKIKAMGLKGEQVSDVDRESAKSAVDEMTHHWQTGDSLHVVLIISASKGIRVKDKRGNELLSYKIYNVANCAVDKDRPEVFLFIARQIDKTNNCHAFYCNDKYQAEAICLSMFSAFQKAFETWMKRNRLRTAEEFDNQNANGSDRPSGAVAGLFADADNGRNDSNCSAPAKRNSENGRRPSTLSEGSAFSFGSQADEAFTTLLSVTEEDEDASRPSLDWCDAEDNEAVLSLLDGEEVVWEEGVSYC